ncbi:MalY/PatB family protein [Thermotoga profunda]|uniref:MalY/PatB family protein n=1 Tax=Thermotoga profunda TaxID=1508420 RepID=UPI000694F10D|nr:PatB family C-S lyase [Thermotoga profunda]
MSEERFDLIERCEDILDCIDRKNTDCVKYDSIINKYGEDVIPAWIADMDFKTAPKILEAFVKRIEHGVFGYTFRSKNYYEAIVKWYEKRHNCKINSEWIVDGPGVVPMIAILVNTLTQPGDKVIIQPPVYPPFFAAIEKNERTIVENRLRRTQNSYQMDFENLEKVIDEKTKLMIISNPHNPVGRVWTYQELERLYSIALKYGLIIISDEIHADIIYKPNEFTSLLKVAQRNVIVLNSPGKTFNVPGLTNSYGIIPDKELRTFYNKAIEKLELTTGNIFGITALCAAYSQGEQWLTELIDFLQSNRDYVYDFVKKNMPLIDMTLPEGTFLMWLDCSKLRLENPQKFFLQNARVYLNNGADFGDPNSVRLNIACSRKTLEQIMERMKVAYDSLNHR